MIRIAAFSLRRPASTALERIRRDCEERPFNLPNLDAALLDSPPRGFCVDRYGGRLGHGEALFEQAVGAVDAFAMYPGDWTTVHAGPGPLTVGSVYLAVVRGYGLYSLLPGRVLERIEEAGTIRRYGFTFGTLRGHLEQGAERFQVSWSPDTDEVCYEARAVSRPVPWLRPGTFLARRLQLRFHRESLASMQSGLCATGAPGFDTAS